MIVQKPKYEIWVPGRPRSQNNNTKSLSRYVQELKRSAREAVNSQSLSPRVDVEIIFASTHCDRGDVDNIIKPILDALKGIAYQDDKQVRSVKATAIPLNEPVGFSGSLDTYDRLAKEDPREFLVRIFEDLHLRGEV